MKIHLFGSTGARAASALLRNCLTDQQVPRRCPVRKCRRDGCCSGPLAAITRTQLSLATGPADPSATGMPLPVCWLSLPAGQANEVERAFGARYAVLDRHVTSTVTESTRAIHARRWRRLSLREHAPAAVPEAG